MRELKFRQAIYIKDKFHHWHYWGFLPDLSFSGPDSINGLAHALDNSQQFTGLSDKSGKEIYEGDIVIVEIKYGEYKEDLMSSQKTVAELYGYSGEFCFGDEAISMSSTYQNGREIIGDIHTTPKLLEKQCP